MRSLLMETSCSIATCHWITRLRRLSTWPLMLLTTDPLDTQYRFVLPLQCNLNKKTHMLSAWQSHCRTRTQYCDEHQCWLVPKIHSSLFSKGIQTKDFFILFLSVLSVKAKGNSFYIFPQHFNFSFFQISIRVIITRDGKRKIVCYSLNLDNILTQFCYLSNSLLTSQLFDFTVRMFCL